MKHNYSVAIGIITYKRKNLTLKLLSKIVKQLKQKDKIFLIENGSTQINRYDLNKISKNKVVYYQTNHKSIPHSRNLIFKLTKNNFDLLAYIDSDCIPSKNWLKDIKEEFSFKKNISIIQGNIKSIPKNNLYAQTSHLLFKLWQEKNTKNNLTKILDTKNISFKLSKLNRLKYLFDETLTFASDIDTGYKLQKEGLIIFRSLKALVYHCEKNNSQSFFQHRSRISLSYRKINKQYNNFFQSASPLEKIVYLYSKLNFSFLDKIKIISLLQVIYLLTFVKLLKNRILIFYRDFFKTSNHRIN